MNSTRTALSGTGHASFEGDLCNVDVAQKLVEFADSQFHRVDVLMNAAGVFEEHDMATVSYEQ